MSWVAAGKGAVDDEAEGDDRLARFSQRFL